MPNDELQDELRSYLDGYRVFDILLFDEIIDMRHLAVTWTGLARRLKLKGKIARNAGFAKVAVDSKESQDGLRALLSEGHSTALHWPLDAVEDDNEAKECDDGASSKRRRRD